MEHNHPSTNAPPPQSAVRRAPVTLPLGPPHVVMPVAPLPPPSGLAGVKRPALVAPLPPPSGLAGVKRPAKPVQGAELFAKEQAAELFAKGMEIARVSGEQPGQQGLWQSGGGRLPQASLFRAGAGALTRAPLCEAPEIEAPSEPAPAETILEKLHKARMQGIVRSGGRSVQLLGGGRKDTEWFAHSLGNVCSWGECRVHPSVMRAVEGELREKLTVRGASPETNAQRWAKFLVEFTMPSDPKLATTDNQHAANGDVPGCVANAAATLHLRSLDGAGNAQMVADPSQEWSYEVGYKALNAILRALAGFHKYHPDGYVEQQEGYDVWNFEMNGSSALQQAIVMSIRGRAWRVHQGKPGGEGLSGEVWAPLGSYMCNNGGLVDLSTFLGSSSAPKSVAFPYVPAGWASELGFDKDFPARKCGQVGTCPFSEQEFSEWERACVSSLEQRIKDSEHGVACVVVELVLGQGGLVLRPSFVLQLQDVLGQYGVCMIFDECLTGLCRCGAPYMSLSSMYPGVVPDMIVLGKTGGAGLLLGRDFLEVDGYVMWAGTSASVTVNGSTHKSRAPPPPPIEMWSWVFLELLTWIRHGLACCPEHQGGPRRDARLRELCVEVGRGWGERIVADTLGGVQAWGVAGLIAVSHELGFTPAGKDPEDAVKHCLVECRKDRQGLAVRVHSANVRLENQTVGATTRLTPAILTDGAAGKWLDSSRPVLPRIVTETGLGTFSVLPLSVEVPKHVEQKDMYAVHCASGAPMSMRELWEWWRDQSPVAAPPYGRASGSQ